MDSDEQRHREDLLGKRNAIPRFDPAARTRTEPAPKPEPVLTPKPIFSRKKKKRVERELSEEMLILRTGTRFNPYPRQDGVETARFTATLPVAVVQREKELAPKLRGIDRNRLIERALVHAMDEYEKTGRYDG